ncbi:DNA-(apurinic or apyrimidinic site) endonuclease 2-like isoform X2 [Daphnia pulicaria]|nr:DNA-(apurinic or apyrimidinic site) endonuclease 2-like isoform X2 [Daphnia pulicaria]XP_046636836.1 DNA-(apurinic or apyrimidinic site) endonuclease 2-like isoform X2 [Daphnia pulicaria]XP_046636837.1 DNA-(apurinic or apyrimidinic site) endonuclease 2-like isoform X2 [Daphnia pulicaria]
MLDESTALVDGYSSFYSFSRKRSGYSGVATYCKNSYSPFQAEEGLAGTFNVHDDKIDFYDNVHSSFTDEGLRALDAEGRCVMTLHKFQKEETLISLVVINVYCPNAGENDERLPYKLEFYRALNLRCHDFLSQGYYVIVLGDMNVSHRLIDHCEPEDVTSFSKSPSRLWLDGFLHEGGGKFVDSFRHLYPTKAKAFTCWNTKLSARVNNYGTRIDYILLSNQLTDALQDCIIMSDVYGSDHCPVKSSLALDIIASTKLPALCTKFFKEFSGKQLKMSTFFCKRTLAVEPSNEIHGEPEGSEPKKMRLSLKTNKQQQSSLLKFFSSGTANSVKESVSSSNSLDTKKSEDDSKYFESTTSTFTTSISSYSSASAAWKSVLKGPPPPPLCSGHQEACTLRTVKKKGPNMNRQFWTCSRATGHSSDLNAQCNFFVWAKR